MVCVYQMNCSYYYQCFYIGIISDEKFVKSSLDSIFPTPDLIALDSVSNSVFVCDNLSLQQISLTAGIFCQKKNLAEWYGLTNIDAISCCSKGYLYVACFRKGKGIFHKIQCKIDLKRCKIVSQIPLGFTAKSIYFDKNSKRFVYINDALGNVKVYCLKRKLLLKIIKSAKKSKIVSTKILN